MPSSKMAAERASFAWRPAPGEVPPRAATRASIGGTAEITASIGGGCGRERGGRGGRKCEDGSVCVVSCGVALMGFFCGMISVSVYTRLFLVRTPVEP